MDVIDEGLFDKIAAAELVHLDKCLGDIDPDVLYLRYDLVPPTGWRLAAEQRTVVELNSDDRSEWRLRSRAGALYNAVNHRRLLRAAVGVVAVSHELLEDARHTLVLGNGADASALSVLAAPRNERPVVVFVGSPRQPWQGADKIVELAQHLSGVDFELVGPGPHDVAEAPVNLTAHGKLSRIDLAPLLARADLALGTLALHRKRMTEASPLKVREALLSGIPTVIAYDDTDLRGIDSWWLLRLPNVESNVRESWARIAAFIEQARGRRVPRVEVESRLDARAKESRRLAFFHEVARASESGS